MVKWLDGVFMSARVYSRFSGCLPQPKNTRLHKVDWTCVLYFGDTEIQFTAPCFVKTLPRISGRVGIVPQGTQRSGTTRNGYQKCAGKMDELHLISEKSKFKILNTNIIFITALMDFLFMLKSRSPDHYKLVQNE